jgi:hypothetical protein
MYENRTKKTVEIVLRVGEDWRENDGGVNIAKIYCKHKCKDHNISFCTTRKKKY